LNFTCMSSSTCEMSVDKWIHCNECMYNSFICWCGCKIKWFTCTAQSILR
jgi:hypothetical protein